MRTAQDIDVLTPDRPGSVAGPLRWSLPAAALVVIVDQLTKAWALDALAPGPCSEPDACIELFAGVRFNLVFNTGAAFTRGSGFGPLIGVLAFVMTGVLLFLSTRREDRFGTILFGVLAGGAVGNLLDRVFRADDGPLSGAVIDFIDLGWWPVFNIADSAIVIGVVGIIAHAFIVGEPDQGEPDDGSTDDGNTDDSNTEASDTEADDTGPDHGRADGIEPVDADAESELDDEVAVDGSSDAAPGAGDRPE